MEFIERVKEARTCRRYAGNKPLPVGTLEYLVDCAHLTPSGKNAQPLRYAIVEQPESCATVYSALRWAGALKDWDGPEEAERPTGYIILCAPKTAGPLTSIDLGISAQTINLAAQDKGLATCMLVSFNPTIIAPLIKLPEDMSILLVMSIGYPVEERHIASVPESGKLTYWRDEKQVHYVPKLALKDVIFTKC